MKTLAQPAELADGYEALRAQATGQAPAATPRGLAMFLAAGLPAWMMAWTSLTKQAAPMAAGRTVGVSSAGLGDEVVLILTEMALGCQRSWAS